MKTITRRIALAVPVTLPLLPLSAFAGPNGTLTSDMPADPAIEAYEEWRKAYRTFLVAMKTREHGPRIGSSLL